MCHLQPATYMTNWQAPQDKIELAPDAVDVWLLDLAQPEVVRTQLWPLLAPDEQVRANRFYFDIHRHRFIVGRGVLRILLGNYLNIQPQAVVFAYGEQGRPFLSHSDFAFNISHSEDVALLAFTWGRELGVDVEAIRPLTDADAVARISFSQKELAEYTAVSEAQKPQAFYNCWTRKEAFIKAVGSGLSYPLDSFDVTLLPGEPAQILQIQGSKAEASKWQLQSLNPVDGYVGALIATGQDWQLNCWQWPGLKP